MDGSAARWVIGSFVFLTCVSQLLLVRGLNSLTCGLLAAGIAVRSAPWIEARLPQFGRLMRRATPALATILALLVGWAVGREAYGRGRPGDGRPASIGRAPNVLLIVLDTVRADHLGLYGYDRDTTPNLARLASRGVRFDRAHSAAPGRSPLTPACSPVDGRASCRWGDWDGSMRPSPRSPSPSATMATTPADSSPTSSSAGMSPASRAGSTPIVISR